MNKKELIDMLDDLEEQLHDAKIKLWEIKEKIGVQASFH
jgi:hypothetical protein